MDDSRDGLTLGEHLQAYVGKWGIEWGKGKLVGIGKGLVKEGWKDGRWTSLSLVHPIACC